MAKYVYAGYADAVEIGGKRFGPGDEVDLSDKQVEQLRASGHTFQGDTPPDPVPLAEAEARSGALPEAAFVAKGDKGR